MADSRLPLRRIVQAPPAGLVSFLRTPPLSYCQAMPSGCVCVQVPSLFLTRASVAPAGARYRPLPSLFVYTNGAPMPSISLDVLESMVVTVGLNRSATPEPNWMAELAAIEL